MFEIQCTFTHGSSVPVLSNIRMCVVWQLPSQHIQRAARGRKHLLPSTFRSLKSSCCTTLLPTTLWQPHDPGRHLFINSHRNEKVAPQARHWCCQAVNTTDISTELMEKQLLDADSLLNRRNNIYRYGRIAQCITDFLKIFLPNINNRELQYRLNKTSVWMNLKDIYHIQEAKRLIHML